MNGTKRNKKVRMHREEYEAVRQLLNSLDVEFEDDYTLSHNYRQICQNNQPLYFPDNYGCLPFLEKGQTLFRPLQSERHSNIIIDMFEDLFPKEIDCFEIQITGDDTLSYTGYFTSDGTKLEDSEVIGMSSIQSLKCACVAKMIMTESEFEEFMEKLQKTVRR
jgi:hypothetical protein